MTTRTDPLQQVPETPDRVAYATGVLLDADAFGTEQLYHRGRLARALAYLHGYGTAAGLQVEWQNAVAPASDGTPGHEERLMVHPGLAIDRLGRMIEVPAPSCISLNPWFDTQSDSDLIQGLHGAPYNGVVVDLFVRFVVCEQGLTPAFLTGPFDALNGVAPFRLRDSYQLELFIRREATPPLPQNPWPDLTQGADLPSRIANLHAAVFAAWQRDLTGGANEGLSPLPEHLLGQDPTFLFLARLIIPATTTGGGDRPTKTAGATVTVDNESRSFVYPVGALTRWLGVSS
jgi:hypothetical protein